MPLPQTLALPLQNSETSLEPEASCGRALASLRFTVVTYPAAQTLHNRPFPKPGRILPRLCSFPPAHLSLHEWKTPDDLGLKSTDVTTSWHRIHCPKLINYSGLETFQWWKLPPDLTVPGLHLDFAPCLAIKRAVSSSRIPSSSRTSWI